MHNLGNICTTCGTEINLKIDAGSQQQVPNSPIDPMTWFMSLSFVVAVTMVKQGYEDWRRHKSDE